MLQGMRRGMLALNPMAGESGSIETLCEQVRHLQKDGFLNELCVVSVVHKSYFPFSSETYKERHDEIVKDIEHSLAAGLKERLEYQDIQILEAPTSTDDDVVRTISEWVFKKRTNFLILGVHGHQNLAHGSLGGIPSTASFLSPVPLLVINVAEPVHEEFNSAPAVLLAVDASEPPSLRALRRFAKIIEPLKARVQLVHILRKRKLIGQRLRPVANFDKARRVLLETAQQLQNFGVECNMEILKEQRSVAYTLATYAERNKIWITAVTSPVRDIKHRLLWGSTTHSLLGHLKCPLLVLRTS
ncbi:universal stress protein [Bdellovibrio bacteriovorus]|uniref:universal stress protein n=1 Tax=Bdellovibrio bacteriovorus TaxID=959 RepID=UPI0035A5CA3A